MRFISSWVSSRAFANSGELFRAAFRRRKYLEASMQLDHPKESIEAQPGREFGQDALRTGVVRYFFTPLRSQLFGR